jgi:RNA polymerase sigma-70 factor (ECF subfamily)
MPNASDADLIARVLLTDDRGAFGELVHRYQSPVRSLLRRLTCGDLALADDLAQETFVRAYRRLGSYRGDARFSTWLYRIAFNMFLGEKRRKRPVHLDPEEQHARLVVMPQARGTMLQVDLERAMRQLTPAERAAVVLCTLKGLTHPEAAQVLDCPVGTVKTHVLRGKEKLKKRLAAWKETVKDGTLSR